ncbi:NAD-dependent epimerase/dehydratase family protein [Castellaniella sp.]|uniref:NAD-dependent epimerase/dehydratase family protein n=1 Tax=Castellaniella sp. TaxID=1955812 RepID=UPI003A8D95B3
MSRTVLLTGGTGFVGRQILRALVERSVTVRLIVRTGKESLVPVDASVERILTTDDLFDEPLEWWAAACQGIDTVIHAAWYAEPGKYLRSPKNLDCLSGTLTLAQACVSAGVRRFVGVGTCFEYDLAPGYLSVNTQLAPTTPYASAKAAAYLALSQYLQEAGVEFAWCRLFYLFGEGEDDRRLVPYLRKQLAAGQAAELTNGRQIRDFIDVREAGERIAQVGLGTTRGPINICSGEPVTVRGLAERIADEYGRRDLLRFGARADNDVDPPCVVGIRNNPSWRTL